MFKLNKREWKYLYLIPSDDKTAQWELIDQNDLDLRVKDNTLEKNARLFRIDKELELHFETTTYLK